MTIRHLKVFVAVCECGGITRAAEALHIAQPAVSCTIAEIEKYYKVTLFERVHQRLLITGEGRELLMKAKEVLAGFDEFELLAERTTLHPTVRIGASLTIGKLQVPNLLTSIRTAYPQANPVFVINSTAVIFRELLGGNLDFGIVEGQIVSSDIRTELFQRDRLVAVCGLEYPVPQEMDAAGLASCDLLLREQGSASRGLLDRIFAGIGVTVAPILESADNQAILAAAQANLGVALLPEGLVSDQLCRGELRRIEIRGMDLTLTAWLISRKNRKFDAIRKGIYELCRKAGIVDAGEPSETRAEKEKERLLQ